MIKAEIYYKQNKAIKISSKFTIPKIMEILEILMNLDYLEFSKSFQKEIQKVIKTGEIFNKKNEPPVNFREKFHNYINTILDCEKNRHRYSVVWLFTKAVYNEKSKFILTEKEERDLVDKALDFNFNAYTDNDVMWGNRIIIDKNEMIDFLHFVDTYYKAEIKIFGIFNYSSKYSISFYWESKFIKQKPNNENILIRYIQSDDLKPETFFKKVNKPSKVKK